MSDGSDSDTEIHAALKWALNQITDSPDDYFEWLNARVRAGDDWAAIELLHGFCLYFDKREPIPRAILEHLYFALSAYLSHNNHTKLEKLLGLTAPAHRKKGTGVDPIPIIAFLYLCIKRDGVTKQEAIQRAADHFHTTGRSVERYDSEDDQVRTLDLADLELLARPRPHSPSDKK